MTVVLYREFQTIPEDLFDYFFATTITTKKIQKFGFHPKCYLNSTLTYSKLFQSDWVMIGNSTLSLFFTQFKTFGLFTT